ncbi:hypothetical protein TNCV_3476201 [Trichonephila clavipes]|nr:hypothetical protein TNCV_3476201 [Trichonephila clavipes]
MTAGNLVEDILVEKGFLWHGGTLHSRRAARFLVRLVAGDERWEAPNPPSKLGWNKLNRTVTCMVLEATANDMRASRVLS